MAAVAQHARRVADRGGRALFSSLESHYEGSAASVTRLTETRDKPAGTIRITPHDHAGSSIVWPEISPLLARYPDLRLELNISFTAGLCWWRIDHGLDTFSECCVGNRVIPVESWKEPCLILLSVCSARLDCIHYNRRGERFKQPRQGKVRFKT